MQLNALGELLRSWREEVRITLRQFSSNIGIDPSNYSKIERGIGPKPTEEVLERIAGGFGIVPRVDARWFEMISAVSGDRGEFPRDLMEEEEIAAALPAFFQRIRSDKVRTADEMYDLFRKVIREG